MMDNIQLKEFSTNQCILKQTEKNGKITYYIPGYLRVKVKNFTEMSMENLSAEMNATIIFTIYYGDLQEQVVKKLSSEIVFLFGRDDAIKLQQNDESLETKISENQQKKQITFTIRKIFQLRIQSQVFWSPFQIINLILSITVQPVTIGKTTVKINLMDHQNLFLRLSYSEQGTFGNYDLAEQLMRVKYTNDRVYSVQKQKQTEKIKKLNQQQYWQKLKEQTIQKLTKINQETNQEKNKEKNKEKKGDFQFKMQHFQYAHFNIPLYKFPIVAMATIFLPLWLLGIINLGIFFQDYSMDDRVGSISALMIAFVALIPTIRQQIPPNPNIVFIQILVYFQSITSLLALIHSLTVYKNPNFSLVWQNSGLFLTSAIITGITIVVVTILMIMHYCIWQPSYNRTLDEETDVKFLRKGKKGENGQKSLKAWQNKQCDIYFQAWKQYRNSQMQVIREKKKQKQ